MLADEMCEKSDFKEEILRGWELRRGSAAAEQLLANEEQMFFSSGKKKQSLHTLFAVYLYFKWSHLSGFLKLRLSVGGMYVTMD